MSNEIVQTTLFDVEKIKSKRRPHTRVSGRKRDYTIEAYRQVLCAFQLRHFVSKRTRLYELQAMFNVGKFPKYILPNDILTIDPHDITTEYTERWFDEKVAPYYKGIKKKNEVLEPMSSSPAMPDEEQASRPLIEVLEDFKKITDEYVSSIENILSQIRNL